MKIYRNQKCAKDYIAPCDNSMSLLDKIIQATQITKILELCIPYFDSHVRCGGFKLLTGDMQKNGLWRIIILLV